MQEVIVDPYLKRVRSENSRHFSWQKQISSQQGVVWQHWKALLRLLTSERGAWANKYNYIRLRPAIFIIPLQSCLITHHHQTKFDIKQKFIQILASFCWSLLLRGFSFFLCHDFQGSTRGEDETVKRRDLFKDASQTCAQLQLWSSQWCQCSKG